MVTNQTVPPLPNELIPFPVVANIDFAQGPIFDKQGNLYFANYIEEGTIGRMSLNGTVELWAHTDGCANGLKVDGYGNIVVADVSPEDGNKGPCRITRIHPITKQMEILTDNYNGTPYRGIYEVCLDSKGNIYFSQPRGSYEESPVGGVYMITMDSENNPIKVTKVAEGLAYPNGMAFHPEDESRFFVGEMRTRQLPEYFAVTGEIAKIRIQIKRALERSSGESTNSICKLKTELEQKIDLSNEIKAGNNIWYDGRIVEYKRHSDGTLSNKRTVLEFPDHSISGFRFDEYNRLWTANWPGSTVGVVDVDKGEVLATYEMGGTRVSNLCWWETSLYVTVATNHSIVRLNVGVHGAPVIP